MLRRLPLVSIVLTIALLAARVLGVPPLADPLGGDLPAGLALDYPLIHLVLSPLFDLWDNVSMLSMSRLYGFVAGLGVLYLGWRVVAAWRRRHAEPDAGPPIGLVREAAALVAALLLLASFVAAGMLWHRPMVALEGVPPETAVADFHAHTSASHDVEGTLMKDFDAEASRRWHRRAGFDVSFVTDHNTVAGFPAQWSRTGSTRLCPGVEVSAWRSHLVFLGATAPVNRKEYQDSLQGVLRLLGESGARYGALAIASLPEYDRNHWANLEAMAAAGVAGFEIVNASPKASEFTRTRRDSVIELAREHNLLLLAVTDSHGWGATVMAWSLVQLPDGWQGSDAGACDQLLQRLRTGGTRSVQIAERHHLRGDAWWPWVLTPLGVIWESWRALGFPQVVSWIGWFWIAGIAVAYRRS